MHAPVLWALVIGFLAGVLLRSFVLLSRPFAALYALVACIAIAFSFFDARNLRIYVVAAVALAAFGGGIIRTDLATLTGDPHLDQYLNKTITIVGVVRDEPDVRDSGTRLSIEAQALVVGGTSSPVRAGVLVLAPPHENISYGDEVRAQGELRLPEAFDAGAGRTFNYPLYLAKDGVLYELAFAKAEATGKNSGNILKRAAIVVKQKLQSGLEAALPEPEAGFAAGITLGDKRSVGKDLTATFTRVSLVHIVVLSGYNITVVINAATRMLAFLPRLARTGVSAIVVAFFILMTGGAATAVRAGFMAFLAVYARLSGRTFLALRALGAAAFVMILWNPLTLAFDPSFELSALATLGLILFTPYVSERLSWLTERFSLREIVSSTIATQITVHPLLLYQRGNLSIVALPANLLVLPTMPLAMALSSIAALAGLLTGPLAVFIGYPAYVLLAYVIEVAALFASRPFAAYTVPAFSTLWLAAAYLALGLLYYFLQKKTTEQSPAVSSSR